jgi:predicted ester cyclase
MSREEARMPPLPTIIQALPGCERLALLPEDSSTVGLAGKPTVAGESGSGQEATVEKSAESGQRSGLGVCYRSSLLRAALRERHPQRHATIRNTRMEKSLASIIQAANTVLFVGGELDAIGEHFTPDYVVHLTGRDVKAGHYGVREFVTVLRSSFPDAQVQVEILLEGKTRVAWQRTFRGTLKRAFKGFPASGLEIVWRDMVTSRFHNGLIAEEWVVTDLAERLLLSKKR